MAKSQQTHRQNDTTTKKPVCVYRDGALLLTGYSPGECIELRTQISNNATQE